MNMSQHDSQPQFIVSACLCGISCRYNGGDNAVPELVRLYEEGKCIAVCPELDGGLPVPRPPCELRGGRAFSCAGEDCTGAFLKGAEKALHLAIAHGISVAILKDKSPSCASTAVYDGTFSGRVVPGQGLAASMLADNGIGLFNENNFYDLPAFKNIKAF